jgi:membrane-associated phospholipid phosphatase
MRMRAKAFGCCWVLVGLLAAETTVIAARPQEPATDGSAPNAQSEPKTQQKGKTEAAKDQSGDDQDSSKSSGHGLADLGKDFLGDQKQIWTSPARLQFSDADWLLPISGFAAGLFVTDRDVSTHLSNDPKTISHYNTLSNAGVAALAGGAAGLWLLSYPAHREHWRETGFLAGEAALNSLVAVEALKYSLGRERPFQGDGSGAFFQGGTSFPSEHAAIAWSVAGVIAHEYPGLLPKIAAYGLASLVSYSRIRARQHFPSDVFIGGMMGQLIAQDVYSRHFDPSLGGGEWRSLSALAKDWESGGPQNLGTPYVPLDSWVYPALERLAALGLVDSAFAGMRPWTRRECMRQLAEAEDKLGGAGGDDTQAAQLVEALEHEFHPEAEAKGDGSDGEAVHLESLYSRTEYISGRPLTDGYNFAQTQFDDFGRPYSEGWNTINGFSAYATWGPWVGYVRAEEQSAPGIPALPLAAREAIQIYADRNEDGPHLPLQPGTPTPSVAQLQLLDTYVGLMLSNYEISFGRQSLWWATGEGGSLDFSDNIQPINMFRINRTTPLKLPSILGWLGPMRAEFFLGQLAGQEFIFSPLGLVGQWGQALSKQPFIHGQNISFKPTRNFEFGFYRTTIFGGEGYPFTLNEFARSLFSTTNTLAGTPDKPGKRTSALDFSYRLPHLRNWVSFYGDGLTYDQYSPIAYMDRSAWHAGLFFSHLPMLPKVDLRVEGVYTDIPGGRYDIGPGSFYLNGTWRSGYTNNGNLIGDWVGRGGQGAQAWTNYWFNARNRFQLNFRHQKVSQQLMPGGGSLTDVGARGDYWVRSYLSVSASVQYERWLFPVIQPNIERPVSAIVEIQFAPQKTFRHSAMGTNETSLNDGGRP